MRMKVEKVRLEASMEREVVTAITEADALEAVVEPKSKQESCS